MCYVGLVEFSRKVRVSKSLLLLILSVFLLGCAGQQVKPADVAAESARIFTAAFQQAYDTAHFMTYKGTPTQRVFARFKLNPKVNEAKLAVAAYDRAVAQYRRTGTGEAALVAAQKNLEQLLVDITKLIQEFYNSDLPSEGKG